MRKYRVLIIIGLALILAISLAALVIINLVGH